MRGRLVCEGRFGAITPSDPPGDAADVNIAARAGDAADNVGGTREDTFTASYSRCSSLRPPRAVEHEGLVQSGIQAVDIHVLPSGVATVHAACASTLKPGAQRGQGGQSGEWRGVLSGGRTCVEPYLARREKADIPVLFSQPHDADGIISRAILVSPMTLHEPFPAPTGCLPFGIQLTGRGRTGCWHRWCAAGV